MFGIILCILIIGFVFINTCILLYEIECERRNPTPRMDDGIGDEYKSLKVELEQHVFHLPFQIEDEYKSLKELINNEK